MTVDIFPHCEVIVFQCLKESFIKAEGSGLSYGLQNLEFICSSEWPPSLAVSIWFTLSYNYTTILQCSVAVIGLNFT